MDTQRGAIYFAEIDVRVGLQRDSTKIEMRGGRCVSLQLAYLW